MLDWRFNSSRAWLDSTKKRRGMPGAFSYLASALVSMSWTEAVVIGW